MEGKVIWNKNIHYLPVIFFIIILLYPYLLFEEKKIFFNEIYIINEMKHLYILFR